MIFFDSSNGKGIFAIIASLVIVVFIFFLWIKSDPFDKAGQGTGFWLEVGQETGQTFNNIKNTLGLGKDKARQVAEEASKEIKKQQIVEETKKYLEEKENGQLIITSPEECLASDGIWGQWGLNPEESCNLKTTDFEKECNDSSDCQGLCLASQEIEEKLLAENKSVEATGTCSELVNVYGCFAQLEQGVARGIICVD